MDSSEQDARIGPVWSILLRQISAFGLGALALLYGIGMASYAGQATALGIPQFTAYGYLSFESILIRGLGVVFDWQFFVLTLFFLGLVYFVWRFGKDGSEEGEDDEDDADPEDAESEGADKTKGSKGKRVPVFTALTIAALVAVSFFFVSWVGAAIIASVIGIVGLLAWIHRSVTPSYRAPAMVLTFTGVVLAMVFVGTFTTRPDLPRVDLTMTRSAPAATETGELWIATSDSWVLVKGSILNDVPARTVKVARIEKAPERRVDTNDLPTLAELIWDWVR